MKVTISGGGAFYNHVEVEHNGVRFGSECMSDDQLGDFANEFMCVLDDAIYSIGDINIKTSIVKHLKENVVDYYSDLLEKNDY